jgi:mRNA interferase RelE/StbE
VSEWRIIILPIADKQLAAIKDTRIRESISKRIDGLRHEPEKQGKPMIGELEGYRSVRAVGQRFRILYKITAETVVVSIVALGIRKEGDKADVYALAKKLMRLGLLGQE